MNTNPHQEGQIVVSDHSNILERVAKTETSIAALERDVHSVARGVEDIKNALSKKEDPNYLGWFGAAFSLFVALGAGLFGVAEYVDMSLAPIRQEQAEQKESITSLREFQHQTHYEMGVLHERQRREDSQHP